MVSPDTGFVKRAGKYASSSGHLHRHRASSSARRTTSAPRSWRSSARCEGKTALIVDDFTISASTLVEAAHSLVERGAKAVYAAVSHGVFTEGSMERLDQSPIQSLLVTDSVETQPVALSREGRGRLRRAALRGSDSPDPQPRKHQHPAPGVAGGWKIQSFRCRRTTLAIEGAAQQGNRSRRLDREILGGRLDADALVVADRAEVREERRVVVFVPRQRVDTALRVGHVQVANVLAGPQHDGRVFTLAGQMVEVDHQLEVGMIDRVDQLETLRRGVDDVGFLPAQRLDRDRDVVGPRFRRRRGGRTRRAA